MSLTNPDGMLCFVSQMFKIQLGDYVHLSIHYLQPQRWRVLALTALLFAGIGLQLANPQVLAGFVDGIQTGELYPILLRSAAVFLAISVIQQIVGIETTHISENVGWIASNGLRTDLLAHTLGLGMQSHKAHSPGEMIERIDGDITALASFFSQFVIQVLGNTLLILGIVVLLALQDWRLGVVVGVFAVVALLLLSRLCNIAVPHWAAEREASAAFFGFLEERLKGTEDIRANGAQAYVLQRFFALMRNQLRKSLKAGWMINIVVNANMLTFAIGLASSFAVGAYLFKRELITIGAVFLVYRYTYMIEQPLRAITHEMQQLQRASASIGRVRDLFAYKRQLQEVEERHAAHLPSGQLTVEFDHITFTYNDARTQMPSADALSLDNELAPTEKVELLQQVHLRSSLGYVPRCNTFGTVILRRSEKCARPLCHRQLSEYAVQVKHWTYDQY